MINLKIISTKPMILTLLFLALINRENSEIAATPHENSTDKLVKIEMTLSAFGVESDDFPSIYAVLDFSEDTNYCVKSFYNPAYEGSTYSLTKSEMTSIQNLIKINELENLNKEYSVNKTDQPRSTTKIYTTKNTFVFDDYGLVGKSPLKELYALVYRY